MPHLEPTYLRYIYDGLIKGSIHPENAAELPEGLIGLYEEAFDERQPVHKRQQLLERFAIWALFKKEVSAEFVAEVLEQPVEEIQDIISTYSAWFNSPESGKYQLYHERLKVYLLQKLSEGEVHTLHEKLISRLEQAIEEQKADEFEWYGLEFLTQHYAVNAMLTGDGSKLLTLAYDQNHWQRQLKVSKGYSWTKSGLHSVMNWASKYNDDAVIECGLQLVDLHHQEQNAAPQIVALVAEGEFDAALQRIEQFGGNDKEGLQRKFILYMLCLMELTLLESKGKPHSKEGIEKLLKHLDEQLPTDHSILNWNDFFPSYLMFQMACEWAEMGLDYTIVYSRTNTWDTDWINDQDLCSDFHVDLLLTCARGMLYDCEENIQRIISDRLAKLGRFDGALKIARLIKTYKDYPGEKYVNIVRELTKQGRFNEVLNVSKSVSSIAKIKILSILFLELTKHGKVYEAKSLLQKIIITARKEIDKNYIIQRDKISGLLKINKELKILSEYTEEIYAIITEIKKIISQEISSAKGSIDVKDRFHLLLGIAKSFARHGNISEAKSLEPLLKSIGEPQFDKKKDFNLYYNIAINLAKEGNIKLALTYTNEIIYENLKSLTLMEISIELAIRDKIEEGIGIANGISDIKLKSKALIIILSKLAMKGLLNKAIELVRDLDEECISNSLKIISEEIDRKDSILLTQGFLPREAKKVKRDTHIAFFILNYELIKIGYFKDEVFSNWFAGVKLKGFNNYSHRQDLSIYLASKDNVIGAVQLMGEIDNPFSKIKCLIKILGELLNREKIEDAALILNETKNATNVITSERDKIDALIFISRGIFKNGLKVEASSVINEALDCSQNFKFPDEKSYMLTNISTEFFVQGKFVEAEMIGKDAIAQARLIEHKLSRTWALSDIAMELANQGKNVEGQLLLEEAILVSRTNSNLESKIKGLLFISSIKFKNGYINEAKSIIQEAVNDARKLAIYDTERSRGLAYIIDELVKQGYFKEALELSKEVEEWDKDNVLRVICLGIAKAGKIDEAFEITHIFNLVDEEYQCYDDALSGISMSAVENFRFQEAEKIGLEVKQRGERINLWKNMCKWFLKNEPPLEALMLAKKFKSEEAQFHYLKGWAEHLPINEAGDQIIKKGIHYLKEDTESLEKVLHTYTLNQLFFKDTTEEKIQRFNRTLNIQWAIDIKNQLPN